MKKCKETFPGLPDPVFHPAGATLPRPSPLPPLSALSPMGALPRHGGRWRLGSPLAGVPLARWWPLCRWLLLALVVAASLAAAIFFLAKSGMAETGGLHNDGDATLNNQDLSDKEPPTGDWTTADEMPAAPDHGGDHDEDADDALTLPGLPGRPAEDASTSTSSTSTSTTSATTRTPTTSTTTTTTPSSSTNGSAPQANQTRAEATGSKTDDDEEMVYDTDELVIEGDDGDAEYEGDTDQTLPEFLESILSLWSSTPAPKVLNGHRYGDTQAGDQWPVASSSSPTPSTRAPSPVVSPTLPPRLSLVHRVTPTPTPTPEAPADDECESPRLPLCRGLLPYDLTLARPSVPQVPALRSSADLHAALPYFELVAQSGCSARVRAFLCPLLEPECVPRGVQPRRPCRKLCRAVAEDCQDFILNNLDLSRVFDCSYYPDSPHGDDCLDLSAGGGSCLPREFGCGDGTCIPQRWLCDGRADCADAADERNCTSVCPDDHFRCKSSAAAGAGPGGVTCVRASLRCDGRQDCADGSDEVGCAANTGAAALGGLSPCPAEELRCLDGRCIALDMLCDGHADCQDAADEGHCPVIRASGARAVRRARRAARALFLAATAAAATATGK